MFGVYWRRASALTGLAICCLFTICEVHAEFTSVINVPPDAAPTSDFSGTLLNIFEGGSIGDYFSASESEVNIRDGLIGNFSNASATDVNISGGSIGYFTSTYGSEVNISGGSIGADFD